MSAVRMHTCMPCARAHMYIHACTRAHACLELVLGCARMHVHACIPWALVGIRMHTCLPRARARVCTYAHKCVHALGFVDTLMRSDEDALYDGRGLTPRSSRACAPGLRACKKMETGERLCSLGPKVRNRGCRNLGLLVTALLDRSTKVSRGPNPD